MPDYTYEAWNELNEIVAGDLSAETVAEALAQLESRGLHVTSIRQVTAEFPGQSSGKPIAVLPSEQSLERRWAQEMWERRGILSPALKAFAEELPPGKTRREIHQLSNVLVKEDAVETLTDPYKGFLSWLPMLHRGLGSEHHLSDLFEEATREKENRLQWMRTMFYPVVVLFLSLAVLFFLVKAVVPAVSDTLSLFSLELPTLTKIVFAVSNTIRNESFLMAFLLLGGVCAFFFLFQYFTRRGPSAELLAVFTKGSTRHVTSMARLLSPLTEALESGATLPTALRVAAKTQTWSPTKKLALRLAEESEHRHFQLSQSRAARQFPSLVIQALEGKTGEPNIPMLRQLSKTYSCRVRDRCSWTTGFLGQFAIVAVGLVVFIVVLAMFLPLVSLVTNLT